MSYTYSPAPVLVETTGEFAIGATGIFYPTGSSTPAAIYDLNDSPLASILVGPKGAHQAFKADIPNGVLDFGSVLLPALSHEAQTTAMDEINNKADADHTHGPEDLEATEGTPDQTTFYRGDGVWAVPAGGGTAASTLLEALVLWDGAAWPERPAGYARVKFSSIHDAAATEPTERLVLDVWERRG